MKVLVWGGMHGPPEQTGLRLVESLQHDPIAGVDAEIANEEAVAAGVRFVRHNLMMSAPGDKQSDDYELRRAAELYEQSQNYDFVLDVHDQPNEDGEYAFLSLHSSPKLLGAVAQLGISRIILVETDPCIILNNIAHILGIELSYGGGAEQIRKNVERLRTGVSTLALQEHLPDYDPSAFVFYQRLREISTAEAQALGLEYDKTITSFSLLPQKVKQCLGYDAAVQLYADYWNGSNPSEGRYFGGVLRQVENPFTLRGEQQGVSRFG